MTKTPVVHKETLLGVLEVQEIEKLIMDNLVNVQKYIFRNYHNIDINQTTAQYLHKLLANSVFANAGNYRKHNIQLGFFEPPAYYQIRENMRNWEEDYHAREKFAKTKSKKIELCAWLMHRFLWIHPFFDYNGRISRLLGELYLLQNQLPVISFRAMKRINFVSAVKTATDTNDLSLLQKLIAANIK